MIVGWTGHRPDVFEDSELARRRVFEEAQAVLQQWPDAEMLVGGQRGVDLWAAEAACRLGAPYRLVLPADVETFTADWMPEDRRALEAAVAAARAVDIVACHTGGLPLSYDRRNERVALGSDLVMAIWTGLRRGGTFYTVCAAQSFGRAVQSIVLPAAGGNVLPGRGV
jgi:hypothetical protein